MIGPRAATPPLCGSTRVSSAAPSAAAESRPSRHFWLRFTQTITEQPDGSLVLSLRLSDPLETERIVLQWGDHAEALEPAALRKRAAAAGQAITRAHG